MSQQPESRFKVKVIADLKRLPRTWLVKVQQVAIRGTPDILACINGHFVALELKRAKDAPTSELQRYELQKITAANGRAYIAYPENWRRIYAELATLALAAA